MQLSIICAYNHLCYLASNKLGRLDVRRLLGSRQLKFNCVLVFTELKEEEEAY